MPPRDFWCAARRFALGACVAAAAVAGEARSVAAQYAIDELEIHLTPRAPGTWTRLIPLRSSSDSVQQVRVTVRDWMRDSAGSNMTLEYGAHAATCGDRLEVFPLSLQLPPRGVEYVRVTYTSPAEQDPGCWAIVLTETVRPPAQRSGGAGVTITTVLGVKVYVHNAVAKADGAVVSADVEEFFERRPPGDSAFVRQLAVRFANTGTAHLKVATSVEIRDEATQLVAQIPGPEAYITPDAFRDILVRVPTLPKGRYVAVVLLDFGGDEITAAQIDFEVP